MFNFGDDEENAPEKISLDELYEGKQKRDLRILNTFKLVLTRIHNLIKITARQKIDQQYCWFIIPEFILGVPSYNNQDCAVYVIEKLKENGFQVKYTHPNLLLISWQHWVPGYVRKELKKKTGIDVDGNGHFVNKPGSGNNEQNNIINAPFSFSNKSFNSYPDIGLTFNNNEKEKEKEKEKEREFRDIRSYNPTGGLVYKEQLLQDLRRKLS